MNKLLGSSLMVSVLLLGCAQIKDQPIGDAVAGAGGNAATGDAGGAPSSIGGQAAGHAGSGPASGAGNGSVDGEQCGAAVCDANADCFVAMGASTDEGVCTPLCNPANQFDQTTWGQPCSGAIGGGQGICRPFLRVVTFSPGMGFTHSPVGICTNECNPLAQDCPDGFRCDLADTPTGADAHWSFACQPNLEPLETGSTCDAIPSGKCAKGATCNLAICKDFCDSTATDACPSGGTCVIPDWFPPGTTVGVCDR